MQNEENARDKARLLIVRHNPQHIRTCTSAPALFSLPPYGRMALLQTTLPKPKKRYPTKIQRRMDTCFQYENDVLCVFYTVSLKDRIQPRAYSCSNACCVLFLKAQFAVSNGLNNTMLIEKKDIFFISEMDR